MHEKKSKNNPFHWFDLTQAGFGLALGFQSIIHLATAAVSSLTETMRSKSGSNSRRLKMQDGGESKLSRFWRIVADFSK